MIKMNIIKKFFKPYTITLTEKYDTVKLYKHIYSGECGLSHSNELLKYIKYSENGQINITYRVPKLGRLKQSLFRDGKHQYIKNQTGQWCNTKYDVLQEIYDDVDIVNCQLVLLQQLMKSNGLNTKYIEIFNNKREDILKDLMKKCKKTRTEIKKKIFKIMFNKDSCIKKLLKKLPNKALHNYVNELLINRKKLIKLYPEFLLFYKSERKRKRAEKNKELKFYNPIGGSLAYIAQHCERLCLLAMYEHFTDKGIKVGALIHDGMHIPKHKDNKKLLKRCEKKILQQTGFKIKLKIKPFEERKKDRSNVIRFDTLKTIKYLTEHKKKIFSSVDDLNIKTIVFNKKYLTKRNRSDRNGIHLCNMLKLNQINEVKSYTGSGKSTMIKKVQKKYKYPILSITSRRSIADMHEKDFNIKNYQTTWTHGVDEAYQADSIDKIPHDIDIDFILVLDENASTCQHLLNRMKKMSENRLPFIKKLSKLINNPHCKMVIGLDSNLNYGTLQFMKDISTKPITLFINNYIEERPTPVNVYINKHTMLFKCIEMIKNGERLFICSNMNEDFKRNVVEPIIKECKLTKYQYLLYSSNEGETKIDSTKWKNKQVIFCTPSVIYGCDSNYQFHVFGFFHMAPHFDAMDCNQQVNRERLPKSINLYMADNKQKPFNSIKDTIKNGTLKLTVIHDIMDDINRFKEPLKNLVIYETYRRSHHMNIRHHLLDLLRQKGYTNINFILKKTKNEHTTKKEYIKRLVSKYTDNKLSSKMYKDVSNKMNSYGIEGYDIDTNDILKSNLDIFINRKTYNQLNNYKLYTTGKFKEFIKVEGGLRIKKRNKDIIDLVVQKESSKLNLLDMIRVKLGIKRIDMNILKSIDKKNYNDKMKMDDDIFQIIKKTFRIRGKLTNNMNRLQLTKFYMSKINSVIGFTIRNSKKIINNKIYRCNSFDPDKIKVFDFICSFKN